ncbi:hypothetical protein PM082_002614 [Marasmius tenuissimus]|nr:hypothetical protein PM082_002614 [Marasmius tenuissimus]
MKGVFTSIFHGILLSSILRVTAVADGAPGPAAIAPDVQSISQKHLGDILGSITNAGSVSSLLQRLDGDGKWTDVDYTTGCAAQKSSWPAATHWSRLVILAGAWHGGLPNTTVFTRNETFSGRIFGAMEWWFERDFKNPACLTDGGKPACPCDPADTTMWNTNWFANVIQIPETVGKTCLLMNDALAPALSGHCNRIMARAYGTFQGTFGFLAGANILDIASIGIDNGILTQNTTLISDAYRRVHNEVVIQGGLQVDGIKDDGSFGQHRGLIYNGNYGQDYGNNVLNLESIAAGSQWAGSQTTKNVVGTLFDGNSWMTFRDTITGIVHWDLSVIGRTITYPLADKRASAKINMNLTRVQELGDAWQSEPMTRFAREVSKQSGSSANVGQLVGHKHFYANDYTVHRGKDYVSTLKMHSKRTKNAECVNTENPFGFHLADGTLYTYVAGNEYEDISASWDWNLIPGTTVDYGATPLNCGNTRFDGIEGFVGGVSDGAIGVSAMRYTNPATKSLRFQKAWFFLKNDVQYVLVSNISSSTRSEVYSVLDQRRYAGSISVNNKAVSLKENVVTNFTGPTSLWHGGIGYIFQPNISGTLSLLAGPKTGEWSKISASKQPPTTVELFTGFIHHTSLKSSIAYGVYPGTKSIDDLLKKSTTSRIRIIQNDGSLSAVYDESSRVVMMIFWDAKGGCLTQEIEGSQVNLCSNVNAAVIYDSGKNTLTVSDPAQTHSALTIKLGFASPEQNKTLKFSLPQGGGAGGSVSMKI